MNFIISPANAQPAPSVFGGFDFMSILPLVLIFAVFYFFLIRPQQKKAQEQKLGDMAVRRDPNVKALENALTSHIGCKVKIEFEEDKGHVKIDFHNLDILEGIFAKMGFKFNEGID